jgi:hypothetical protein
MASKSSNTKPPSNRWVFTFGKPKLRSTLHVRRWIKGHVRNYAWQIGITEQDMPHLVITREEVRVMPLDEVTVSVRNETSQYLGVCFVHARTISINVRKFASLKDLKGTIVHELVHYRFQYLGHGERFEKRVSLILKGKQYRPLHVHDTLTKNDAANGNNNIRAGGR